MSYFPSPLPVLNSGHVLLRPLKDEDLPALYHLRSHPDVYRYLTRKPDSDPELTRHFMQRIRDGVEAGEWAFWAICAPHSDELAGTICLWNVDPVRQRAEVGYMILPEFQGRGLAGEALVLVLEFAWSLPDLEELVAVTHRHNLPSIRLLESAGFTILREKLELEHPDQVGYFLEKG